MMTLLYQEYILLVIFKPLVLGFTSITDIFFQDEFGNTALIGACQNGHINTTRILLNHGAYVDKQNKVNSTNR